MTGSRRGRSFMDEEIEVLPEETDNTRSKRRKLESDILVIPDTPRTRSHRRNTHEDIHEEPEPVELRRRNTPRRASFVAPPPPPQRSSSRRNARHSDEEQEEEEEDDLEEVPTPVTRKPKKRKGGPGRKKKVVVSQDPSESEASDHENTPAAAEDSDEEDPEPVVKSKTSKPTPKAKGKSNGRRAKSEENSEAEENGDDSDDDVKDADMDDEEGNASDDNDEDQDEDQGDEEENEEANENAEEDSERGPIKLTIKPPKQNSDKKKSKIKQPSMIYGRTSRVPPPEIVQASRKRKKIKGANGEAEEIPSDDEIHSDEDLVEIDEEDRPAFEKMKADVGVPVVVLPKRGNQEFYFATDIARWSGLEKANRLYDRCPMMGHFNSDSDETALFIERNLMSRHLKGRSVGIVKASDVFRYVYPRLDEFRKRGMMLEEKRNETRVDKPKAKEVVSFTQSYFPPEVLHIKFAGSRESLIKNATHSATTYNSQLLLDRRNREKFFDPNTQVSQVPLGKLPQIHAPTPTLFPIALMKGQHIDSFTDLTPEAISKVVNEFVAAKKRESGGAGSSKNVSAQGQSNSQPTPTLNIQNSRIPMPLATPKTPQTARSFVDSPLSASPAAPSSPMSTFTPKPSLLSKGSSEMAQCSSCNRMDEMDVMLQCAKCHTVGHPGCMEVPEELIEKVKSYPWHCFSCKVCMVCSNPHDEHLILLCDECDRGCHTYCATPKLTELPSGHWACSVCKEEK